MLILKKTWNSKKKILLAFLLNLCFSAIELIGGFVTGSISILSDSVHDFGDALSIGLSYFFEKKSKNNSNQLYTYGYAKYSILGSVITTLVLLCGSAAIIIEAIQRLIAPIAIQYDGMIILAIIGVSVNIIATVLTKGGNSSNQKAVNLHMMEDVFGWLAVLIGAILMLVSLYLCFYVTTSELWIVEEDSKTVIYVYARRGSVLLEQTIKSKIKLQEEKK